MATWTYYAHDSRTGEPVAELPLREVQIEDVLSGTSSLTGTLDLYDPMAARVYCAPWLREVTAVRDGVIAMHGPVVARRPKLQDRSVQLTVSSPHAYMYKRFTEGARNYKRDQFSIVRSLIADATAKTGGSLYRYAVTAADSGVVKALTVGGTERQRVSDLIESLAQDAVSGFDFRWDYTWSDPVQHLVQRTLTLGYPTLGRDLSLSRVVQATMDLVDVEDSEDGMVVANRVHVLGAGTGTKRLRSVMNSGSSLNAGYPLLEEAFDQSDVKERARLDGIATHLRNSLTPGVRNFTTTHSISPELPYGAVDLGDKVGLTINSGVEQVSTTRRVVTIRTTPQSDQVSFVYYDPTNMT